MDEKEIRFTKKRVDEAWKETVAGKAEEKKGQTTPPPSGLSFASFVTSLGLQALVCLGEVKAPGSEKTEVDLDAARETIDLLVLLREKTKGNLTAEEQFLMNSLIPDLQLKFVQHRKT